MIVEMLDELFLSRLHRRMSVSRALTYLTVILLITLVPVRRSLVRPGFVADDVHATMSLGIAIDRAFCGQASAVPADNQLSLELQRRQDLSALPIRDIIVARWGSIERYCAAVVLPVVNNENSLMLVEAWLLRLMPRLSLAEISRLMLGLQIAMLAILAFSLLRTGAGVLVCAGVLYVGIDILLKVQTMSELSVYTFLACLISLLVGCCILSLRRGNLRVFVLCSPVLGGITAYAANMRTSYLPMFAAFFATSLAGLLLSDKGQVRRISAAVAACALFSAGYLTFHYGFISSRQDAHYNNYSYHPIAHPLVLSLAVPSNALAVREEIRWDDRSALRLARRVNPSVEYLGNGYESALFGYYFGLWRRYPHEMFGVYSEKWHIAGASVVAGAMEGKWNWTTTGVLTVLRSVTNGFWFLAIFLAVGIAAFAEYVRARTPLLMGICLLAVAAAFLLAETAIIMPYFVLNYHQSLLFVAGVLTLFGAQGVVSLLVAAATLVASARTAAAPPELHSIGDRTIADFGEQWSAYTDNSGFYGSPELLRDVFGPLLPIEDIQGAVVADIGAGTGRFTKVFVASGAAKVVAVEPSRAFDVLVRNTAAYNGQVDCVRSDAEHFTAATPVDFAFSYGVLHHIPDPRGSVAAMHRALKSGGRIGVWLYGREGNEMYVGLMTLLTAVTRRLSHASLETCVSIMYVPTLAYMWLCRLLPLPMRHYFVEVFSKLTPDKRRLTIYDQLNPAYAKYYWQQEVRSLLEDAGFVDVRVFHRHGYSWTALGLKP